MNKKEYLEKYLTQYNTLYNSVKTLEDAIEHHLEEIVNSNFPELSKMIFNKPNVNKHKDRRIITVTANCKFNSDTPVNKLTLGLLYMEEELDGFPQPFATFDFNSRKSLDLLWSKIPTETEEDDSETGHYFYDITTKKGTELEMYFELDHAKFKNLDELRAKFAFLIKRFNVDYKKYMLKA